LAALGIVSSASGGSSAAEKVDSMFRALRATIVAAVLIGLAAGSLQAGPRKLLEDLDKAMKDYANNIQTTGENAGKFLTGKDYSLTALDAAMKAYVADTQKTGDDALADLKPFIHDLLDIKTYLPEAVIKAWQAFVAELAVLRARFLRRCENPWADDPPAGGGANPPLARQASYTAASCSLGSNRVGSSMRRGRIAARPRCGD
jgi:hypothetical protein